MSFLTSIRKLHYKQNWLKAIFSMMSREVLDPASGEIVLFFKMTWKSSLQVYKDKSKQQLLMESRLNRHVGMQAWEVFLGEKKMGSIKNDLLGNALSLGTEKWAIMDAGGKECLKFEGEGGSTAKHLMDNMTNLYNPTHVYEIKTLSGQKVGTISSKHGIFSGFYDLEIFGGKEEERALALALFSAMMLMLKK